MQRSTAVWTLSRTLSIHLTCGGNPHVVSDVVGRDHADLDPAFRTAARRLPYSSRPIRGTRLIAVTRPSTTAAARCCIHHSGRDDRPSASGGSLSAASDREADSHTVALRRANGTEYEHQ